MSVYLPCRRCGRRTPHVHEGPNTLLHMVLCCVTCGLWVVPWAILAAVHSSNHRCERCGEL